MSSKKKNRKKNRSPAAINAAEKITEQLNAADTEEDLQEPESILAEIERKEFIGEKTNEQKVIEAEKRMVERLRRSEEAETSALNSEDSHNLPASDTDVKEFVPHSRDTRRENDGFADNISEALSEDSSELSVENEVNGEDESGTEAAPERPNKLYLVFAVFVIVMSVIGIISTVSFFSAIISNIANRTELKNDLALFLYPIVAVDPPDCDTVDELPPTIIVESAIWRIILTGDNSNYEKLYNTYMYVPAIDVEFSVRSIYGNSVPIQHQTVGSMDTTFTYIEDMNSYLVPINPHYAAYSPRVTDVTNVGELYTVTVEYIPPSALAVEGIEFEVNAQKTMVYTLSKSKNVSTLHSIKNITRYGPAYEY